MTSPVLIHERAAEREQRNARTRDLFDRARTIKDPDQRRRLIEEIIVLHMPLANGVVSRYTGRGVATEDLRQVAYLALTRAAHRFDSDRGTDFASYAVPSMRGEVRKHFRDHAWMVRPTRRIQELQPEINSAVEELWPLLVRPPTPDEIAHHVGEPREVVEEALSTNGCFSPTSLDTPMHTEESGTVLADLLGADDPAQQSAEARAMLEPVIAELGERDRDILYLRFVRGYTQREVAAYIGTGQMRVSRLLSRILRTLRTRIGEVDAAARAKSP